MTGNPRQPCPECGRPIRRLNLSRHRRAAHWCRLCLAYHPQQSAHLEAAHAGR